MSREHEYILGTDETELVRLGIQHRLWAESTIALWEQAQIMPGSRVLDVGSGPGYAAIDLAQLVGPRGAVVAVEQSPGFAASLRQRAQQQGLTHLQVVQGDAEDLQQALAGREPFDAAYIRWVLCFLQRPERTIQGVAAALAPGGRLAVQDYFNYEHTMTLAPREEAFTTVISAIARSWRERGGDPDVMGRVPHMCIRAGLNVRYLAPVARAARPQDPLWQWPETFWASFLPRLQRSGHISAPQRAAFEAAWAAARDDPSRYVCTPQVMEMVAEKT